MSRIHDIGGMRSLGAMIWKGGTEMPGHGTYSIIADPTGAVLGLWRTSED